ncbi:MAG: hypothetical protein QOJ11_2187 [Frankiales bacterium]|jgi:hypothetical protein|nr:hypothetical protein [Frankiales bacterium]
MTDLDTLLSEAAHPDWAPVPDSLVDADLARGRRAFLHRRMRRTGTRSALAAVVAVGAFAAAQPHGGHSGASAIRLVDYTGTQPAGYTVDSVPAGWEIQGVSNYDLAIAPVGFADQRIDNFEGKLVVMLLSKDATPPTTGTAVDIGVPGTGRINHANPEPILDFQDAAGHWVEIQVPVALHWSDAQVTDFGNAVHVNPTAQAGLG